MTRRPRSAAMEPARNGRDDPAADLPGLHRVPAAMEPARNGRDDAEDSPHDAEIVVAAMEPARNGRDDNLPRKLQAAPAAPQWSPPVMGGMTRPAPDPPRPRQGAAMEPARNGRDD